MREWIEIAVDGDFEKIVEVLPRMREWIEITSDIVFSLLKPRSPSYEGVD